LINTNLTEKPYRSIVTLHEQQKPKPCTNLREKPRLMSTPPSARMISIEAPRIWLLMRSPKMRKHKYARADMAMNMICVIVMVMMMMKIMMMMVLNNYLRVIEHVGVAANTILQWLLPST